MPDEIMPDEIERLIQHVDERFNRLQEGITHIKERIPTAAQHEARIAHLEREQRRLEDKLDELWRDHTRFINRIE